MHHSFIIKKHNYNYEAETSPVFGSMFNGHDSIIRGHEIGYRLFDGLT